MYKKFKPIEVSKFMLEENMKIAKFQSAFSKYGVVKGDYLNKVVKYIYNNNESIIDILKIYDRMLNMNTKKDISKYKDYLSVFSGFKMDMDYMEDDAALQGVFVQRFIDDFIDMPFNIEYNDYFSIKDMLKNFHPAIFDDTIWEYVTDETWDIYDDYYDSHQGRMLKESIHESYIESNSKKVTPYVIDKFNAECKGDLRQYYSDEACDKIERLEKVNLIDRGVILYYSDDIDEFMERNKDNKKALNLLIEQFSELNEVLLCECLRTSEIMLVDKESKFIPGNIENKYIFMSAFYSVGSMFKRSEEREEDKSVSICNGPFFCMLIDSIEEIKSTLENKNNII